jgi:hypothetical protein
MNDDLYNSFLTYFGDVQLKKIKCDSGYCIYAASNKTGLSVPRYLFAVVPQRFSGAEMARLSELRWISLQTRTTNDIHAVPTYTHLLSETQKKTLPHNCKIIDRTKNESLYTTDNLPIKIKLLHESKKNNYLQYPDNCKLYQALETYNCVIELL